LNAGGVWDEENCLLLPRSCEILKSHHSIFSTLFNRTRYLELVGPQRVSEGYSEIPTLGIKIYRVWGRAGIKPHMGSPGRLVHSLALSAPRNPASTLTVAEESREWVEGQFHHFDDSFFHSVHNPHPVDDRIVLAIVATHPDLLVLAEDSSPAAPPENDSILSQGKRHEFEL
jgi:hypothetical protein